LRKPEPQGLSPVLERKKDKASKANSQTSATHRSEMQKHDQRKS